MRQKLLLALFALLAGINASAQDAEIDGIYYNFSGEEAEVTSGSPKYSGDVVIPESVTYNSQTYTVTSIGGGAFSRCESLTSITIPNSVTSIGLKAFENCSSLASITIPKSVETLKYRTFYNCDALVLVRVMWETPITLSNNVFSNFKAATLFVPVGCVDAYRQANNWNNFGIIREFKPEVDGVCYNLDKEAMVAEVTKSNTTEYSGEIVIPETITYENETYTVTSIGNSAFSSCTSLTSVIIGNGVTSIGDAAFYGCSSLTSVAIPNSVTSIGNSAFVGCSGLTSITIGSGVASIGEDAFRDCTSLTSVHISDLSAWCRIQFSSSFSSPLTSQTTLYLNDEEIIDLVIPDDVTSIGTYAFWFLSHLTSVTIPESVTSIGGDAFMGCSGLTSVTIGSGVTFIEFGAFIDCSSLTDVLCYAENVPNTNSYAFNYTPTATVTATLHVPAGSIDAYKVTEPWSSFGTIVALGGGATGDLNGDGKTDIADAVSILNLMAEGADDSTADLNGDGKVDIADFVSVLNLMAGQ